MDGADPRGRAARRAAATRRRPGPGDDRGGPVGDAARRHRRRGRSGPTARSRWPTSSTCRASAWPRLVEKGSALTDRWATNEEGRRDAGRARRRGGEAGRVGARRPGAELPRARRPAGVADRARRRCWSGCASTPSGPASSRSRSRRTSRAGPGWRCARATCDAAIAALEQGRDRDRGYLRRGRRADYHAVFLAGLYLEAGELDCVDEIIADAERGRPTFSGITIPGLAFHLACRRGDLATAERHAGRDLRRARRTDLAQR